jgi:nucleotide-binding universal stress UspA family protein
MMKSILVALDGSPASLVGLTEAVSWAERLQAELRGFYVENEQRFVYFPPGISAEGGMPVAIPLPAPDMARENEKIRKEGDEIQAAFEAAAKGLTVRCTFHRERGNVNAILTREARSADLVVIGRRGHHEPPSSSRPGPTTETLIHQALRPVLVVPEHPASGGGSVFAYDGSRGVQRVLVTGTQLAKAKGGAVHVISILDDPDQGQELRATLERYWAPYGIQAEYAQVPRKGKVSTLIVNHATQKKAGLIVMGAFGHNPIRELLFGSTTLDVLEHTPCPVLLMD